ncbi:2-amino-4-hydroxy-6-hydroxymethyldihydropteridine diphosphokinase [Hymenobacter sp. BT559]|uniref:2-amino-4-hydroxy-6- hydroxymethyldihydropteridine diphosphokinase n=1 Tax=Hymenobacter sp. BT559 TaxID=2795729 RepID=UPI0018EE0C2E|nr:2-amino-4-hydroxy-6-hydroxymethyldihydropteridine diphosphokinase [Hymenobacter sp. BT559]MBJ6143755.1 2-amino-4-hydroxy-6-hydroxymethyldihydropteridine diphosphokinase [Hymenobacter sp. BT559]
MSSVVSYLLLGGNLGDRVAYLQQAQQVLAATAGAIVAASAYYETAAWGVEDQPAFLNQVLAVRTALPAAELLAACLATEQQAGRERRLRWGARTLDVDILFYGQEIINTPTLTVPHPALPARRFALVPLAELAPGLVHPQLHQTVAELLAHCPDPLEVTRVKS